MGQTAKLRTPVVIEPGGFELRRDALSCPVGGGTPASTAACRAQSPVNRRVDHAVGEPASRHARTVHRLGTDGAC